MLKQTMLICLNIQFNKDTTVGFLIMLLYFLKCRDCLFEINVAGQNINCQELPILVGARFTLFVEFYMALPLFPNYNY